MRIALVTLIVLATAHAWAWRERDPYRPGIRMQLNRVRSCYEAQLGRDPALAGRIAIEIVVDRKGKVIHSTVVDSTMGNGNVEGCVAAAAGTSFSDLSRMIA